MVSIEKSRTILGTISKFIANRTFQKVLTGILTLLVAFTIVLKGATPEKYKLKIGDVSKYNITATRDIEDKNKTRENAKAAADAITPVMIEIKGASVAVINSTDEFITAVEAARLQIEDRLEQSGLKKDDEKYKEILANEQDSVATQLSEKIKSLGIPLSYEQALFLAAKSNDEDIRSFKKVIKEIISETVTQDITSDNLAIHIYNAQNKLQATSLNQDLKNVGSAVIKAVLKPNNMIDEDATRIKKEAARNDPKNKEIILKGKTILDVGDIVTVNKYELLKDLNLLEESRFDFGLAAGIFIILLLLATLLIIYMNMYCKKILANRSDLLLLSVIIVMTLIIALGLNAYSPLAIPIFIAAMQISIFLDMKLAIMVNFILTIAISFFTKDNFTFVYMAMISGTFSAFIVTKANQRNRLFIAGIFVALTNVLIVLCLGIINKIELSDILRDGGVVFLNGLFSIILTIGLLPFWESTFNVITPLKLMELANPNQPLIKRLLMEAPGTYHHSLMVGNLAEVAAEAIGGNALLARVGAYFHDVGKLKRPNFFKENQMSDNPHDRMTANLSTLVITSHVKDGIELAEKYKIPQAIRDIIIQHHGTTLVAYFYHKAKKCEKVEEVKPENFRYEGPKPSTREAAVVMLADSVEAAVRAMIDKTEGKIEGLVRKIIKDKLDDGQLDLCDLTLKDLDAIARGFMKVLSGFFHERQEYPEIKQIKSSQETYINFEENYAEQETTKQASEGSVFNGSFN